MVRKSVRVHKPTQVVFPATGSAAGVSATASAGTASASIGGGGGGTTPLFQMVVNADEYPLCGFDNGSTSGSAPNNVPHTKTLVTNGTGPGGRNYVRVTFTPSSTLVSAKAWGWSLNHSTWMAIEPSISQGATRYLRYRFRVPTPFDWAPTSGGAPGNKFIDFSVFESNSRSVTQLWGDRVAGELDIEMYRGGGGGPGYRVNDLALDTWHHIQAKMVTSSTAVATDGALHLYVNNDVEASPTGSATGIAWDIAGFPGSTSSGAETYIGSTMDSIDTGRSFTIDFCDFEYDDEFDTNWTNP